MSGLEPIRLEIEESQDQNGEKERAVDARSLQKICSREEEKQVEGRCIVVSGSCEQDCAMTLGERASQEVKNWYPAS